MITLLHELFDDPENVRRDPPTEEAVASMAASLGALGQLQPVVIRERPGGGWFVTIGRTRVAAARKLGWNDIDAIEHGSSAPTLALSAAENMVRTPMREVDQWLAMAALMKDSSFYAERAADALGIDQRTARRLSLLGNMAPEVIDAIRATVMPNTYDLRVIAAAPHEMQREAIKRLHPKLDYTNGVWRDVADACRMRRIPMSRAIFDVELDGVTFDEDLFAEPGTGEQFTTTDVAGFLEAQQAALDEQAKASNGRIIVTKLDDHGNIVAPKGYRLIWDQEPKRWKKADPRRVCKAVYTMRDWRVGEIVSRLVEPTAEAATGPGSFPNVFPSPTPAREPINKVTLAKLAEAKNTGIRLAVREFAENASGTELLRLVLLVFCANNVSVRTTAQAYGSGNLCSAVIELGPTYDDAADGAKAVYEAACRVIERTISCSHPNAIQGSTSGQAADWIGAILDAVNHQPRIDTPEILKGIRGPALVAIAEAYGINSHGTPSQLRARMAGNMPGWKAPYDAGPAPTPRCETCDKLLNQPDDPLSKDCGGDCLRCMAEAGDPECVATMEVILRRHDKIDTAVAEIEQRACRVCGCTDADCSQCVEKTGVPCHWVQADLCSACAGLAPEPPMSVTKVPRGVIQQGRTITGGGLDGYVITSVHPDDDPPPPMPSAPGKRTRKRTNTNATAKAA